MFSYHVFFYPFKWSHQGQTSDNFTKQIDLSNLDPLPYSHWQRNLNPNEKDAETLYDEKCYFYPFVRDVLYDTGSPDTLVCHYERREPQSDSCYYQIEIKKNDMLKRYRLPLKAMNLNFYSTGVGMLTFYLCNDSYSDFEDILAINQYGRRIFPPFFGDIKVRSQIAECISLEGLAGDSNRYREDFAQYTVQDAWKPARFIQSLIADYQPSLSTQPIIDDRMFVSCWYANQQMADQITSLPDSPERFSHSLDWYRYIYVDADDPTCQHERMRQELVGRDTYFRWANYGTLYGITRYSFMLLTGESDFSESVLAKHLQTIYTRMVEFVLIQKMSILKFSEAVTDVSNLRGKSNIIAERIGSLYKEYIRFMNQYYFKEVSAQDQGIELYTLLEERLEIEACAKDLDEEIGELHGYVSLMIDGERNQKADWLNIIAALVLPPTVITGLFGMNTLNDTAFTADFYCQSGLIILITYLCYLLVKKKIWMR